MKKVVLFSILLSLTVVLFFSSLILSGSKWTCRDGQWTARFHIFPKPTTVCQVTTDTQNDSLSTKNTNGFQNLSNTSPKNDSNGKACKMNGEIDAIIQPILIKIFGSVTYIPCSSCTDLPISCMSYTLPRKPTVVEMKDMYNRLIRARFAPDMSVVKDLPESANNYAMRVSNSYDTISGPTYIGLVVSQDTNTVFVKAY